jgi:hypothetical protein
VIPEDAVVHHKSIRREPARLVHEVLAGGDSRNDAKHFRSAFHLETIGPVVCNPFCLKELVQTSDKVISVHGLWLDSFGSVTGRHGFATVREGQNTQRLRFRLEGKLGACRWVEW